MAYDDYLIGHKPLRQRINVRKTLTKYRSDPLFAYIDRAFGYHEIRVLHDDVSMYQLAYSWYVLSLQRYLPEMSLAVRWYKGPYWALREGRKYSTYESKLAQRYNEVAPYLYLDFYNCLLYARILLDRVTALSRHFLTDGDRPSFTSFNDHRKFFKKRGSPYGRHEAYAAYIRDHTDWFEMPLKHVRDHFIVHAAPKHMRFFGYPMGDNELALILNVPVEPQGDKPLAQVRNITVSVPRLAEEVHSFLTWFNDYAIRVTERRRTTRPN